MAKDLKDNEIEHTLASFTYLAPLDLSNEKEESILEARFGGWAFQAVDRALANSKSGYDVLSAKGRKRLKALVATSFRHPAASFKKHKRRTRKLKQGQAQVYTKPPCTEFDTDSYPTGIPSVPTFQVIADSVVPVGWVYPNKLKSDLMHHVKDHFPVFGLPFSQCERGLQQRAPPGKKPNSVSRKDSPTQVASTIPPMAVRWREIHVPPD